LGELTVILNFTLSEEIKGDLLSTIFPKGTNIPVVNTLTFHTVIDKQKTASMTICAGESTAASKNRKILNYTLSGIPELTAGEGKIKTEYKISTAGILYVTNYIHETGLVDRRVIDLKKLNLLTNE
jgi:molecular chaperone DnaK (HSP70)